jgi:chromosomal replication initiator protein
MGAVVLSLPQAAAAGGVVTIERVTSAVQWPRIQAQLRADLGEDVYGSWFARLVIEEVRGTVVHLSVPTRFLQSWITEHYYDRLLTLWQKQDTKITRIEISTRSAARNTSRPVVKRPISSNPAAVRLPVALRQPQASEPWLAGSPLDQRFTFGTFCEGVPNRMALAAAKTVAENDAPSTLLNPLYVYGDVGRGKTHLLHAIARAARQASSSRKVLYLTAEYFMFRFAAAVRDDTTNQLRERLENIDLLLIDDMQFLQGKFPRQDVCHLLHTLLSGAGQVVIAADRPLRELEWLEEGTLSRIKGGVAFEIAPPDLQLRKAILDTRHAMAKEQNPGLDISPQILEYVARSVTSNGRDLEGALNRLVAQWLFTKQPVVLASAEITLRDLINIRESRRVKIEDILRIVAQHYGMSKLDIVSSRRTRIVVRPRQVAMYLAKVLTPRSLPEIGRHFGGRDHTTVLHAVRKIEGMIANDKDLAEQIEILKRMLQE